MSSFWTFNFCNHLAEKGTILFLQTVGRREASSSPRVSLFSQTIGRRGGSLSHSFALFAQTEEKSCELIEGIALISQTFSRRGVPWRPHAFDHRGEAPELVQGITFFPQTVGKKGDPELLWVSLFAIEGLRVRAHPGYHFTSTNSWWKRGCEFTRVSLCFHRQLVEKGLWAHSGITLFSQTVGRSGGPEFTQGITLFPQTV